MKKLFWIVACLALILSLASGCQGGPLPGEAKEETQPPVETLALVVTEENISQLEDYPHLKYLDLTGSTCYEAILAYAASHPGVEVLYSVTLDTVEALSNARELILDPGTCTYETLSTQLAYLPRLEKITLPRTDFSPREIIALEGLYPQITWDYSVILLGQELPKNIQELNLSVLTPDQVDTAAQMLGLFPELTAIDLMDPYGNSNLSKTDLIPLMEAAPQASFRYTFDLFGTPVSTTDTRLEFIDQPIGNEGEAELRLALAVLKDCEYFLLDNCGIDNEILGRIRQDFPETHLVWRVFLGEQSFLTDATTVRAVNCVSDKDCQVLQYCDQLRYLDLSWNSQLQDLRFLEQLPELEILLLSGCPITDLTPLANARKLIFLELAYCATLEDISPLAGCTALAYLNLSYTSAADMTPLHELPLEQFYAVVSKIPWTQQEELAAAHPECGFRFDGTQAYGTGWRYRKSGALTDMYARVLEVFGLESVPN